MDFLRPHELSMMKQDINDLFASAEANSIIIHHKTPLGPVTFSPVYGTSTASGWTDNQIPTPAIQKIVNPKATDILKWGVVEAGDAIFYLPLSVDLSIVEYQSAYIESGGIDWIPVPPVNKAFFEYLAARIGDTQFCQVMAAKSRLT